MEQKVLSLNKGIRRTPAIGEEGELLDCVNLVVKDGELRNAPVASDIEGAVELGDGEKLLYIHSVDSAGGTQKNYIVKSSEGVGMKGGSALFAFESGESVLDVKALGNVLIVNTSVKMRMYMWMSDGYKDYTFDGIKPLDVRFVLDGRLERMNGGTVDITKVSEIVSDNDLLIKSSESIYTKNSDDEIFYLATRWKQHIILDESIAPKGGESYVVEFVNEFGEPVKMRGNYKPHLYVLGTGMVPECGYALYTTTAYEVDEKTIDPVWWDWFDGNPITSFGFTVPKNKTIRRIGISTYSIDSIPYYINIYKKSENEELSNGEYRIDTSDENKINTVLGAANRFINEKATSKNKFVFPFLVRTAVKLIDGSYILPSMPTMMIPSRGVEPKVSALIDYSTNTISKKAGLMTSGVVCDLYYKLMEEDTLKALKSMSGIVDSVVICVTEPIRRYKQNPTTEESKRSMRVKSYESSFGFYGCDAYGEDGSEHRRRSRYDTEMVTYNSLYATDEISLPENESICDEIDKLSNFYIIERIPIEQFVKTDSYTKVKMDNETLKSLVTRNKITDNTFSLQRIIPKLLYVYNNRLSIANYSQRLFGGYSASLMTGIDKSMNRDDDTTQSELIYRVALNINGKIINTGWQKTNYGAGDGIIWFFYPHSCAKSVIFCEHFVVKNNNGDSLEGDKYYKWVFELKEHPIIKGAYIVNEELGNLLVSDDKITEITEDEWNKANQSITDETYINIENGILQSYVNNPFEFNEALSSQVGKGEIKALSTTTKALSEGQFGSFPLIAFTDEGIWAISINGEGKFEGVQPVSRDCILDGTKPLQTDNAVVFATSGGLNVLSGSEVADISDNFEGMVESAEEAKGIKTEFDALITTDTSSFNEDLNGCEMIWDGENKLLHLYAGENHYIRDMKGGEWSKSSEERPDAIIPGYPRSTVQMGTILKEYRRTNDNDTKRKGFFMTRDVCFGAPMTMKMLAELKLLKRVQTDDGSVKVAVFVSNDREKWYRLKSLKVSSWKWYRFAVYTDMGDVDSVSGIVCRTEERRGTKLR